MYMHPTKVFVDFLELDIILSNILVLFRNHSADKTTTGGVVVYWDTDPDSQRIGLWTIEPGGSWYEKADCTGNSNKHKITYIIVDNNANTRSFYEYNLKR